MQRKLTKSVKKQVIPEHTKKIEVNDFIYQSVSSCTEFLSKYLHEENLFSGSVNYEDVELCLDYFKKGFRDFSLFGEPRITAFVLKRFVREIQESLFPEFLYWSILESISKIKCWIFFERSAEYGDQIQLANSLKNLSTHSKAVLSAIIRMLRKVEEISPKTLSACWGATLFKICESYPDTGNKLVEILICNEEQFMFLFEAERKLNPKLVFQQETIQRFCSIRLLKVIGMHRTIQKRDVI